MDDNHRYGDLIRFLARQRYRQTRLLNLDRSLSQLVSESMKCLSRSRDTLERTKLTERDDQDALIHRITARDGRK